MNATSAEPPTPYVRVDLEKVKSRIEAAQRLANAGRFALVPNFKTHRMLAIADWQIDAGATGISCATVREAEALVENSAYDVFICNSIVASKANRDRLRELAATGRVVFAISSADVAATFRSLGARNVSVMLEVDTGCKRSGVGAADVPDLWRSCEASRLQPVGIFSYAGGVTINLTAGELAARDQNGIAEARDLLGGGIRVSGGSTPALPHVKPGTFTEYRPGTYVFGDRFQSSISDSPSSTVALTVEATVVAAGNGLVTLDAGAKVLGRDLPPSITGYAGCQYGVMERIYDHHGIVRLSNMTDRLHVGDRVSILPNNCNSVVALADQVWTHGQNRALTGVTPLPWQG